jgi:hypothetical protein
MTAVSFADSPGNIGSIRPMRTAPVHHILTMDAKRNDAIMAGSIDANLVATSLAALK